MTYKPLPKEVTVKKSSIEGLGLFATQDIEEGHEFGITHVKNYWFEDGYIRTPLGGFFNHSDKPNCEAYQQNSYIKLKAIKDIQAGEELTAKYWLYDIKKCSCNRKDKTCGGCQDNEISNKKTNNTCGLKS